MTNHLQNKKLKTFLIALLLCLSGMTTLFAQSISQGAVSGHAFTVNADGDQVLFSKKATCNISVVQ